MVVYTMLKSKAVIDLALFLKLILFRLMTIRIERITTQNFLEPERIFCYGNSMQYLKLFWKFGLSAREWLYVAFFEAAINVAPIFVACILVSQQ